MNLISRYMFKKCLFNTSVMLLSFVMLFALFNVIGQLNELGKGDYTLSAMLYYTLLQMPNFLYLLMPLGILIGVMIGMLSLVSFSEFAIIRTSGISLRHIMIVLLTFGTIFSVLTFLLGEFIAPAANNYAQFYKKSKTHEVVSTQLASGVWSKDGDNTFVNISQILPDASILGVSVLVYDKDLKLIQTVDATRGSFDYKQRIWTLENAKVNDYTPNKIISKTYPDYKWKSSIEPKYFNVLIIAPEDMSAFGLLRYMHHLNQNHQNTKRYQIAFWSKLLYPIACITMSLIALAFIPNNRRSVNLGTKLFVGILIGVSFFFSTRLIGFMALIFNWNPILSAVLPTTVLLSAGWYFVMRKE